MLGRETTDTGRAAGWLRISGARGDSGAALLLDADGAAMPAVWVEADSLRVTAFNDFLRVVLVVRRSGLTITGSGTATSDAELIRDSSGRLRDLRRQWRVSARQVSCDSMPREASATR